MRATALFQDALMSAPVSRSAPSPSLTTQKAKSQTVNAPPHPTAGLERTLSCQFPTLVLQHHWKDQMSKGWRIIFKTNELQSTSCEKGKEPITFLVRPQRDPVTRVV